uniref:CCHC-type domain-containing protein n=1 Tax=Oryza nivara TaxID=4536 RepID=A0A0E0G6X6_ORYNI
MAVDNNSHNSSALLPTPALVEANHGRSNIRSKGCHKTLLASISAAKVHNQKPAPQDQASWFCLNCRKPGHCFSNCPLPRVTKALRRCSQVTSIIHDTNRHLKVQPPPQRIVIKGTVKGHTVPPAIVSSLQRQRQQARYNYKEAVRSFVNTRSKCCQHQVAQLLSVLAMHLVLLQSRGPSANHCLVTPRARRTYLLELSKGLIFPTESQCAEQRYW